MLTGVKGSWVCLWSESDRKCSREQAYQKFAEIAAGFGKHIDPDIRTYVDTTDFTKEGKEFQLRINLSIKYDEKLKCESHRWVIGYSELKTTDEVVAEMHQIRMPKEKLKNNPFEALKNLNLEK